MSCPVPLTMINSPSSLSTYSQPPSPSSARSQRTFSMLSTINLSSKSNIMRTLTPASPSEAFPSSTISKPKTLKQQTKVKLGKGCSLLDWIRLCRCNKDVFCCNDGTPRGITESELARHNTQEDAWTAIRGKVYNISPYMKFHPGGVEDLLKSAGKDCTLLFDEAHKWVNIESMLKFCFVGPLIPDSPNTQRRGSLKIAKKGAKLRTDLLTVAASNTQGTPKTERRAASQAAVACEDGERQLSPDSPIKLFTPPMLNMTTLTRDKREAEELSGSLTLPEQRIRKNSDITKPYPRFDWVQSEKAIIIRVLTQCPTLKPSDIVIDMDGKHFDASLCIGDWVYEMKIELEQAAVSSQVTVNGSQLEILLKKQEHQTQWTDIGSFLPGHTSLHPKSTSDTKYHPSTVESITTVTHDSKLFTLRLPIGSYLNVPTGHHLSVRASIDGESVVRSYTPVCSHDSLTRHAQAECETINLMVKLYKDGKMSRFLSNLNIGDKVWLSDPEGTFDSTRLGDTTKLLLVAAGTGLTPMVTVFRDFLNIPQPTSTLHTARDHSECPGTPEPRSAKLLFANKTEKDILWREELDQLATYKPNRFEVAHVLSDKKESQWGGMTGRIDISLIKKSLLSDKEEQHKTLVCICGPCAFTAAISNILLDLNYPLDCVQCFT